MVTSYKSIVSVIGGHQCDGKVEQIAIEIGKNIAQMGYILMCGGLSGVMQFVAKGAKQAGGLTIGILPGDDRLEANPYIDVPIATGMGLARNTIVVCAGDVVIAMPGEAGTLSEIGFALNMKKPVIDMGAWDIPGMIKVTTAKEAISALKKLLG